MMDDDFIEGILTLDSQGTNATMNRKFIGMEAVQANEQNDSSGIGLDADSPSASENGGDNDE